MGSNLQDRDTQAWSNLFSAPNSEIRQASEKFQAYLVSTKLMRKHSLLKIGLQQALLAVVILQTQTEA